MLSLATGHGAALVVAFGTNLLLARTLGAAEYGTLALLLATSQALGALTTTWSLPALITFGAQEHARTGSIGGAFAGRAMVALGPLSLALLPMGVVLGFSLLPVSMVLAVAVHLVASGLALTAGAALQAAGKMADYGWALTLERLWALPGLLALVGLGWLIPVSALVALAIGSASAALFGFLGLRGLLYAGPVSDIDPRSIMRYSAPLALSTGLGMAGTQWLPYIVIHRWLSPADLGLYALAAQLAGVVGQAPLILSTALLPRAAVLVAEGPEALRRAIVRWLPWVLVASVIVFDGALLGASAVPFVFGAAYEGAVMPLLILLGATAGHVVFLPAVNLLLAHGATWTLSRASLAVTGLHVALMIALVPVFGLLGAAGACLVSSWVGAALMGTLAARRCGWPGWCHVTT